MQTLESSRSKCAIVKHEVWKLCLKANNKLQEEKKLRKARASGEKHMPA